jgi:hypothetical protein
VETAGLAVVLAAIYLGGTARRDRRE